MNDFQKQVKREFRLAITAIHAVGYPDIKFEDWSKERKAELYRDVAIFEEVIDLATHWEERHVQTGKETVDAMLDRIAKELIHMPEKISFFNP
ncbi:MAG TPA: hypothetical protein VN038_01430 [Dyadobacter sp.]|nr:hypothetical protein [Dyadobacter sp.]